MRIKVTIVAYAFSVQYFENATIVAYVGLRVKELSCQNCSGHGLTGPNGPEKIDHNDFIKTAG